jgi:predicted acylesterase/phospholipase RssA
MRAYFQTPRTMAIIMAFVIIAFSSAITAQDETSDKGAPTEDLSAAPAKPLSIALTVSGGVSLGAYQAGYLFYLTEVAKLNSDLFKLRLATGASAGMINALLTLITMGNAPEEEPENSLFYKLWITIRYNEILDVENAPPLALSSRAVLEKLADEVEKKWNKGLTEELDMVLGATATRQKTYDMEISEGFSVARQEEKFVFRVKGRGPGRLPKVTNYVDRTYGAEQPLLPFVDNESAEQNGHSVNFSVIRQILFASSAIPIVFPSQKIDFCMTSATSSDDDNVYALRACSTPRYTEEFYDGSLADRRPLRLAYRIAASGLEKNENNNVVWRERPSLEQDSLPDNLYFFYIDPTRKSYPDTSSVDENEIAVDEAARFFPSLGIFMRGFLTSARSKEVATVVDEHPEIRERIQLVTHDFPSVSDHLGKFFGFFDREFRKFDFYLGMRDARYFLESKFAPWMRRRSNDQSIEIVFPESRQKADEPVQNLDSWQPYFCLRAEIDGQEELGDACYSEDLRDFSILLQVAFDRLYDHCRRLPYDETLEHVHCKRAMAGKPPPRIWNLEDFSRFTSFISAILGWIATKPLSRGRAFARSYCCIWIHSPRSSRSASGSRCVCWESRR